MSFISKYLRTAQMPFRKQLPVDLLVMCYILSVNRLINIGSIIITGIIYVTILIHVFQRLSFFSPLQIPTILLGGYIMINIPDSIKKALKIL